LFLFATILGRLFLQHQRVWFGLRYFSTPSRAGFRLAPEIFHQFTRGHTFGFLVDAQLRRAFHLYAIKAGHRRELFPKFVIHRIG